MTSIISKHRQLISTTDYNELMEEVRAYIPLGILHCSQCDVLIDEECLDQLIKDILVHFVIKDNE